MNGLQLTVSRWPFLCHGGVESGLWEDNCVSLSIPGEKGGQETSLSTTP